MKRFFENVTLEETETVAAQIIDFLGKNRLVALYGEMGMGKTTLTRAISYKITGIRHATSPTFSLINAYNNIDGEPAIYHFDCYRLDRPEELRAIGYEEYFYGDCFCFVEWPEKIKEYLPDDIAVIKIENGSDENHRNIIIEISEQ